MNAAEDSQRSSKFPVNDLAVLDEIAQRRVHILNLIFMWIDMSIDIDMMI